MDRKFFSSTWEYFQQGWFRNANLGPRNRTKQRQSGLSLTDKDCCVNPWTYKKWTVISSNWRTFAQIIACYRMLHGRPHLMKVTLDMDCACKDWNGHLLINFKGYLQRTADGTFQYQCHLYLTFTFDCHCLWNCGNVFNWFDMMDTFSCVKILCTYPVCEHHWILYR